MHPYQITLLIAIYLICSFYAALHAWECERPRDVILIHFLLGPLVIGVLFLSLFTGAPRFLKGFLAGAWSDFRDRFH